MMLDVEQGSLAWHSARLGVITSSRIKDIMKKGKSGQPSASRKNYMFELLLERLTGEQAEHYTSPEMQRGIEQEQFAADAYELQTFNIVEKCGFFLDDSGLKSGSSPDRLVGDDGLVEIKNPNTANHIETILTGEIKDDYIYQMQDQLRITGRLWCDYVSYDSRCPINLRLYIKRIERDEKMIEEIRQEVEAFLKELDVLELKVRSL